MVTGKKDLILRRILEFYCESSNFNGIPHWQLHAEVGGDMQVVNDLLEELLAEKRISLNYAVNPHIKQFEDEPSHAQMQALKNWMGHEICIYPSKHVLAELPDDQFADQPFTRMIHLGKPQMIALFFSMEVLEFYYQKQDYIIETSDYKGFIACRVHDNEEEDDCLLSSFGLGCQPEGKRVLAVYLKLLNQMPPEHQQWWYDHLVPGPGRVAFEYQQEMIRGEKPEYISIFQAFIEELHHINQMALLMFGKKMFINDFTDGRPESFKTIFRPTRREYFNFVRVLDMMMPRNLNEDFFSEFKGPYGLPGHGRGAVDHIEGLIAGFSRWLKNWINGGDMDDFDLIFKPFKKIHQWQGKSEEELCPAEYGNKIVRRQNELVIECYNAVKMIRLLFTNHPLVRDYELPDWLLLGKVTIY